MDRVDGSFSRQNNYINSYCDHSYARFLAHDSFSGNQPSISIRQFPTPDNISKCSLMKVLVQVAEPIVKELLGYITEYKMHPTTLETYALEQGFTHKWLTKHFTDVQLNTICTKFDLTLKLRCIELFKEDNQTVISNERLKTRITTTTKKLKDLRDDLCHNRVHMTKSQCLDKANTMDVCIGDLLEIIQTCNKYMDVTTEKKETNAVINKIMNANISEEDFIYMCLQEVLNSVVECALNKVTQLLCCDKKQENFKKYFERNGMAWKKYKNDFFDEEKNILESNSEEIRPDVALHTKIIEKCMEWHPLLKKYPHFKKELISIIREIRSSRNYISHNMLSMSPTECRREAQILENCLVNLDNFLKKKIINTEAIDASVLDISQIYIDIDFIMLTHTRSLPSFCSRP